METRRIKVTLGVTEKTNPNEGEFFSTFVVEEVNHTRAVFHATVRAHRVYSPTFYELRLVDTTS